MSIIMSTLVIVGLLFGGGATVAAAQNDLPNEPLYQLKLLSEDAQLLLTADPAAEINLLMEQAQTRTEEMVALSAQGVAPDAALVTRAQERTQQALHIAASLGDAEMTAALLQIRTRLQTQEQLMTQLNDGTCLECEPVLQQTRAMLQTQLGLVEDGLTDPQAFRNQNQIQNQVRVTQTPLPADDGIVTPTDSLIAPQGTCETCTPALDGTGQQNGANNSSAGTPMPQNGETNQNDSGLQNGGGNDNGNGTGNNPSPNSGGQGGKP